MILFALLELSLPFALKVLDLLSAGVVFPGLGLVSSPAMTDFLFGLAATAILFFAKGFFAPSPCEAGGGAAGGGVSGADRAEAGRLLPRCCCPPTPLAGEERSSGRSSSARCWSFCLRRVSGVMVSKWEGSCSCAAAG